MAFNKNKVHKVSGKFPYMGNFRYKLYELYKL